MAKDTDPKAPVPLTLNDHARALFAAAPPPMGEKMLEYCKALGVQPFHLAIGHWIKADQRGELHAPLLLEEWTATSEELPQIAAAGGQGKTCPSCKRKFQGPPNRPEARFCCNFCGSGRYERDQTHHPDCEFFIRPGRTLAIPQRHPAFIPEVVPDDPQQRLEYEQRAYQRHLQEVNAAEQTPGGLPAITDAEMLSAEKGGWSASPRRMK